MQRKYLIALVVCLLGLGIDQTVKTWVYNNLSGKVPSAKEHRGGPGRKAGEPDGMGSPVRNFEITRPPPVSKRITVIEGYFYLDYAENEGMAFGMFQEINPRLRIPLFLLVTSIAVLIILHLLKQAPAKSVRLPVAMGLILSGAFGNLTDRFRWGSVVDFLKVIIWPPKNFPWPTFNVADTFITIGILLLLIDMFLLPSETSEPNLEGVQKEREPSAESVLEENSSLAEE